MSSLITLAGIDDALALVCCLTVPIVALIGAALVTAITALRRAKGLESQVDDLKWQVAKLAKNAQTGATVQSFVPTSASTPTPTPTPKPIAPPEFRPTAPPAQSPEAIVSSDELEEVTEAAAPVGEFDSLAARLTASRPRSATGPLPPATPMPASSESPLPKHTPSAPPKPPLTREAIMVRLFVWIGGVALAAAGAYLVKFSFDRGLLRPEVRLSLGALFGLALVVAGDMLRKRSPAVAQAAVAAGVAVFFAVIVAGMHIEHVGWLTPTIGFALLAITAGAAVALSLRHGPFVAVLGLIGGFLTPAIVSNNTHSPGSLFAYLFILQMALVAVTRLRHWWWLALMTLMAGYGWAVIWMAFFFRGGDTHALGLFLLASSGAFILSAKPVVKLVADGDGNLPEGGNLLTANLTTAIGRTDFWLALTRWSGAVMGLLLTMWLVRLGDYSLFEWGYLGILGAAIMVFARLDQRHHGLAWMAATATLMMVASAVFRFNPLPWGAPYAVKADGIDALAWVIMGFGVLYAVGAFVALWRSRRPGSWASLSLAAAMGFLLLGYWAYRDQTIEHFWGVLSCGISFIYAMLAMFMASRRERAPGYDHALAALSVAAAAFLALAVPLELDRQWITVAWALLVPIIILIDRKLRIPALRVVAFVLTTIVVVRLLANPEVLWYPIGTQPIVNWLLYGYGVPVLAFGVAGWLLSQEKRVVEAAVMQAVALALTLALVTLEIRHFFHRDMGIHDLGHPMFNATFPELGTYVLAWMLLGLGTALWHWPLRLDAAGQMAMLDNRDTLWRRWAGASLLAFAVVFHIVLLCLILNPAWYRHDVGQLRVFNWLLYVYGLPVLILVGVVALLRRWGQAQVVWRGTLLIPGQIIWAIVIFIAFVGVNLEVRQAFRGAILSGSAASQSERYAYSATWVIFGSVLLALGIWRRSIVFRWASLIVMLMAVGKVFLRDTAQLGDLYRVFSFLGLGLVLLALGYVYHRFVFGPSGTAE